MLHFAPHDPKRLAWDAYQRARGDLPRDDRGDEPPPQLYASPAILALWYAIKPLSDAQARLARALYDELTNLAPISGGRVQRQPASPSPAPSTAIGWRKDLEEATMRGMRLWHCRTCSVPPR